MSWYRLVSPLRVLSQTKINSSIATSNSILLTRISPLSTAFQTRESKDLEMFTSRTVKIAASAALISGTYYGFSTYNRYLQATKPIQGVHFKPDTMELSSLPPIKPTSVITGPTKLDFNLTLFQYCSCPFCCKTRTLLDYFGFNYDIVEVNPVMRQQLKWSKDYRKVPILLVHSKPVNRENNQEKLDASNDSQPEKIYQINDSSVIASCLGSFILSKRQPGSAKSSETSKTIEDLGKILVNYQTVETVEENNKVKKEIPNKYFLMLGDIEEQELEKREGDLAEERYWRDWTDRVLVHSLSPNIYRTIPEAIQAFESFSTMGQWDKHFTSFERFTAVYAGSAVMWLVGKNLKKKYRLKDDVRESLYDNCRQWTKAIGNDRKFMGGSKPNLADLSVYGVLSSIEGCTAFKDLLQNTNIKDWYYSVKEACNKHVGKDSNATI